jgi:hypothetical protein
MMFPQPDADRSGMMRILSLAAMCACLTVSATTSRAAHLVLYDATLGTAPQAQGSLAFGALPGVTAVSNAGGTTVNTLGSNGLYAGYSNYNYVINLLGPTISPGTLVNAGFPVLDRAAGFSLLFTVQMNSQVNDGTNGPDRAGFSVTLLSSDRQGIEIGFRTSDIFSQSGPGFTVGESNSTASIAGLLASMTAYQLDILGNVYALSSGGNVLLTGAVRDYTTAVGFASDGYRTSNFLALGDNTTSARASFTLQQLAIVTAVPEPATWALTGLALLLVGGRRMRNT